MKHLFDHDYIYVFSHYSYLQKLLETFVGKDIIQKLDFSDIDIISRAIGYTVEEIKEILKEAGINL